MPSAPTYAFPTARQIAVALIALMFTVVPRTGAAQDSRIGLYHQTLFPSRDSGSTSVSGNQIQGAIYGSERAGGWGFAFREPWYTSATVGPFYDVTEWLEVGVALGAESLANDAGVYSTFGRIAGMVSLGNDKLSMNLYYENGASNRDWYQIDADWRPSDWLALGVLSQTHAGTGPRVTLSIPGTPIQAWVAPALFDRATHGSRVMIGVQLVHTWSRE